MARLWPGANDLNAADRVAVVRATRRGENIGEARLAFAVIDYSAGLCATHEQARRYRWVVWFLAGVALIFALTDSFFGPIRLALLSWLIVGFFLIELLWWPRKLARLFSNAQRAAESARRRMPAKPPSEHEPHQHRQVAESFGSDPERYDRARPRYPEAMVDRILAGSPGSNVLDVGCGTGIAARQFQAAGCRVLGVEVDARMADLARRNGLEVEVAAFEAWDPGGRAFDVVVCGQAWHWVDPVAGAAKAAQVLRRDGRLALFWNVFQPPPEVGKAFSVVYRRVLPDLPVYRRGMPGLDEYSVLFTKGADGIREAGVFGDPEQWRFDWERSYTRDEWLDQLPTHGGHSQLSPAKQGELLTGIGAALDAVGGSFTMRYATIAVTATRTGAT